MELATMLVQTDSIVPLYSSEQALGIMENTIVKKSSRNKFKNSSAVYLLTV